MAKGSSSQGVKTTDVCAAHVLSPIRPGGALPTWRRAGAPTRRHGVRPIGKRASSCRRQDAQPPSTAARRGRWSRQRVGHAAVGQPTWRACGAPGTSVSTRSVTRRLVRRVAPRCIGSPGGRPRSPSPPPSLHRSPAVDTPHDVGGEGSLASFCRSAARSDHRGSSATEIHRDSPPTTGRSPTDTAAIEVRQSRSWVPSGVVPPSNRGWSDPSVRMAHERHARRRRALALSTSSVDASNVATSDVMSPVGQRAIRGLLPQASELHRLPSVRCSPRYEKSARFQQSRRGR